MSTSRVFVANRGEIAVRVLRACSELGFETVLAVSDVDRDSLAAGMADRTVCVGPAESRASYLNQTAMIAAALNSGADAVHPGYGFLSENSDFAASCEEAGMRFVGPDNEVIRIMGNKLEARRIARECDVPVLPGSTDVRDIVEAQRICSDLGFPVMLKAAAGGGGKGIRVVHAMQDLGGSLNAARAEAHASFGDDSMYIERYVDDAWHIEVQVFGDSCGNVVHLGDRDCSLQRRHQKVIEEAPASRLSAAEQLAVRSAAVRLAEYVRYQNAGTVEFLFDGKSREFYFLEMNTRIQVEHPVTEMISGIDLVQWQLLTAFEADKSLAQWKVNLRGHAIECRINAESPERNFLPSPGVITRWCPPVGSADIRLDSHCYESYEVLPYYDSLIGKLATWGKDRSAARERLASALDEFTVSGVDTNIQFQRAVISREEFVTRVGLNTRWLETVYSV